jgi:hypothetical protein
MGAAEIHQSRSRLLTQCWDEDTGTFSGAHYNADLCAFCLQACQDAAEWDALNLTQWHFWVLPQQVLKATRAKSVSQATVERLVKTTYSFVQPLTAATLKANFQPLLAQR